MAKRSETADLKILTEYADGATMASIGAKWGRPGGNGGKALTNKKSYSNISSMIGKKILSTIWKNENVMKKFVANTDNFRANAVLERLAELVQSKNEHIALGAVNTGLDTLGMRKTGVMLEGRLATASFVMDLREIPSNE